MWGLIISFPFKERSWGRRYISMVESLLAEAQTSILTLQNKQMPKVTTTAAAAVRQQHPQPKNEHALHAEN